MRGKTLEYVVLIFGLLVIGAAVFLMYIDTEGVAAQSINLIFSIGFIIYITYAYILSNNLNKEIRDLNKIVANLKEEVTRLTAAVKKRDKTIGNQKKQISEREAELENAKAQITDQEDALSKAKKRIAALESEAKKEGE